MTASFRFASRKPLAAAIALSASMFTGAALAEHHGDAHDKALTADAVVAQYANVAHATYSDALASANALRAANAKFTRRFARIEAHLAAAGKTPDDSNLAEMDALWNRAKAEERGDA